MFYPGALWTAAHNNIPLLSIMHNNRVYHAETMIVQRVANQRRRDVIGSSRIVTVMDNQAIDFGGLTKSFGVWSTNTIAEPRDLEPVLKKRSKWSMLGNRLYSMYSVLVDNNGVAMKLFCLYKRLIVSLLLPIVLVLMDARSNIAQEPQGEKLYHDYGCVYCHGCYGHGGNAGGTRALAPSLYSLERFGTFVRTP